MKRHEPFRSMICRERGHVLLAALTLIFILSLLGMSAFYLAGQDVPGITAMREESAAQHLAEAAAELVMSWFHDAATTPPSIAGLLVKRQGDLISGPSFFDTDGRSQFIGTSERPDVLLDAASTADDRLLNGSPSGFSGPLRGLGRVEKMKIFAPLQPGLLGTLEVTASTAGRRPLVRTIRLQLGALNIPAVRAAVQVGQGLGTARLGEESPVLAHWGDVRVMGDLSLNKVDDLVVKSGSAPVTGQSYEVMGRLEDRWVDYRIGGEVFLVSPPLSGSPVFPANVHLRQLPTPGIRLDQWDYGMLKQAALRHGRYYRLDRAGRLHALGAPDSDPGLSSSEVLASSAVGQSRGLVFIDTLDGEAPRADNLGTLVIEDDYVEALLVVQGHVLFKSSGAGRSVPVLSPPPEGMEGLASRIPVTLPGVHVNGLLYVAGTVTLERSVRVYGAVTTSGTVIANRAGVLMEVWYNADLGKGLFRGLPVVYRAPGMWQLRY